ncbi:sugar ABC transporter ATP-binding protein [Ruania alba]|uniref:Monosaccharide ABC transporter ATP-binding protein, CUT2 family n=1 Tax=Ruania alba TaxID=648782 RepID=A0A1H5CHS3_9MICO|nr:sugar ABC transporter ATP-binding protein [Ruania alba]SED66242.1 monosaccharide ABC transporter ATP-binding protein, CUT2 family [Ruania alba]
MSVTTDAPAVTPLLEARDLVKTYPGVRALDGVSLRVFPGEVHALLGENGAGKSTLLKALFGAHRPDSGTIAFEGEEVQLARPGDAIDRGIAMVHQELSLIPQLNAIQNVVLGREAGSAGWIDWRRARREAVPALAKLGFSASAAVPVGRLSVAQQQLVELARAVAAGARLIIMDEPTASLTTHESDQLFEVIRQLRSSGCAIVYVSHRLPEVLDLADRVTVLRDGSTIDELARSEITGEDHLIRLMVGRELDALGLHGTAEPGEPGLEIESLSVPGLVHQVSLTVRRGEIVGMAGMVGAGRTELALGLIGALRSRSQQVRVAGRKHQISHPRQAIDAGIAYLPEDRKSQGLGLHMSIAANVTLPAPPGRWGMLDRNKQRHVAADVMTRLGSKTPVRGKAGSLSGGNQQKIVVGRWLLTDSDVYIFDEPTRGIDVGAKGEIHRLMRRLADDGKAVLMISSDLPEVLGMSDRILVMRRGRIVADLDRHEATEESVVAHAAG